jgi:ADP-dependent phosphofructokinase/glucokinase
VTLIGLKALEVQDISELELACLMNVLVKPQLDNGILVQELESIIQNAPQILNMVRLNLDKI